MNESEHKMYIQIHDMYQSQMYQSIMA